MIALSIPTSDLLAEYKRFTKDTSSTNETIGKARMNYYYNFLLSEANNYVLERTKYGSAKENQRSYLLPPDYQKMKNIRFLSGDIWHPLEEVKNLDKWFQMTQRVNVVSIPQFYMVLNEQGQAYIELEGVPDADATNNIEITYEGFQNRLLFPTDYTTGTIAISNGSATVTGTTTVFTSAMVGRFIRPTDGKYWYEIKTYTDATHLTLVNVFQETTISGSNFVIAELPRLPAEFAYTPLWGAAMDYWMLSNKENSKDFEKKYLRDLRLIQDKYKNKTKGAVSVGRPVGNTISSVPKNYPKQLIG